MMSTTTVQQGKIIRRQRRRTPIIKTRRPANPGAFVNNHKTDPEQWLDLYGDALYSYALMRIRNPAIAEDLVQETFLAGLRAHERFAGKSSEKTWLIGILKHKLIDHLRKAGRQQQVEDIEGEADRHALGGSEFDEQGRWKTPPADWPHPERALEQDEFWQTFSDCLAALPDHLADLFILREIQGIDSEDVRRTLEISTTNNMWVMLSRTRQRLRRCLEKHWFHQPSSAGQE